MRSSARPRSLAREWSTKLKFSSIFGSVAIGKGTRYDNDKLKCSGQDTRLDAQTQTRSRIHGVVRLCGRVRLEISYSMISEDLWKKLSGLDIIDIERRSLSEYNPVTQSYRLRILNKNYDISPANRSVKLVGSVPGQSPDFYLQLAAVNYLIGAKDLPLTGKWTAGTQFPSGPLFFRGPHKMPTHELEKAFGRNQDGFASLSLSFGGKKVDGGDCAFEFFFFPRLPVRLILWVADEEFPARMVFLFDRSANQHFKLDGLWAVGKALSNQLLQNIPEIREKDIPR